MPLNKYYVLLINTALCLHLNTFSSQQSKIINIFFQKSKYELNSTFKPRSHNMHRFSLVTGLNPY